MNQKFPQSILPKNLSKTRSFRAEILWVLTIALLGAVLSVVPAVAETPEDPLEVVLSIDLAGADVVETFTSFARVAGAQISLHPKVAGKVTYGAQGEKLADILDGICRQKQFECFLWAGEPEVLRVQPSSGFAGFAGNIDLDLAAASLGEVLDAFTAVSDQRVHVSGVFKGKVTITMQDQPWPEVLETICAGHDCVVDWTSDPITVVPSGAVPSGAVPSGAVPSGAGGGD